MGYCPTCNEWVGYGYSYCEDKDCETVRKLISLYGIKTIGKSLNKIFVRNEEAIENRTENIDKIVDGKIEPSSKNMYKKDYELRSKKPLPNL